MATQQFKTVSIRDVVMKALRGEPINVHSHELFDLSGDDLENDDQVIIDEFTDKLEAIQTIRDYSEYKSSLHHKNESDNQKEVVNEPSQPSQTSDEDTSQTSQK